VEEKNFIGLNLALMRSIWLHANETDNAFLFVAEYESIDQAAIFVISHGSTATYLAGWNGAVGRKLNCNNLLLWKASCALADLGLKFFDLGGIDEIETPSISSFKAGMGGETYLTSGEYISF
jgi:lipid II:glycine glycyltransferase (peptidoglycan interpeptide bridge formation enzyme)